MKLNFQIALFLLPLVLSSTLLAQTSRILLECEKGAPRLNRMITAADGRSYAVGSLGRIGVLTNDGNDFAWQCLPVQDELYGVDFFVDTLVVAGDAGQIWYRANGTWQKCQFVNQSRINVVKHTDHGWIVATSDGGLFRTSSLRTADWFLLHSVNNSPWYDFTSNENVIVAVGHHGQIWISNDAGGNWHSGFDPVDTLNWKSVARLDDGRWMVCGEGARCVISADTLKNATNWKELYPPYPRKLLSGMARPDAIDFIFQRNEYILVGGFGYRDLSSGDGALNNEALFISRDYGSTWKRHNFIQDLSSGLPIAVRRCVGVRIVDNELIAVTNGDYNEVYHTAIHRQISNSDSLELVKLDIAVGGIVRDSSNVPERIFSDSYESSAKVGERSVLVVQTQRTSSHGNNEVKAQMPYLIQFKWNDLTFTKDTLYQFDLVVNAMIVDGSNWYFGCDSSIVLYTNDSAKTWSRFRIPFGVSPVVRMGGNQNRLLAQLATKSVSGPWSSVLVTSFDNGNTWKEVEIEACHDCVSRLFSISQNSVGDVNLFVDEYDTTAVTTKARLYSVDEDGMSASLPELPKDVSTNLSTMSTIAKDGSPIFLGIQTDSTSSEKSSVMVELQNSFWTTSKIIWNSTTPEGKVLKTSSVYEFWPSATMWWLKGEYPLGFYSRDRGKSWFYFNNNLGGVFWRLSNVVDLEETSEQLQLGTSGVALLFSKIGVSGLDSDGMNSKKTFAMINEIQIAECALDVVDVELYDLSGTYIVKTSMPVRLGRIRLDSEINHIGVAAYIVSFGGAVLGRGIVMVYRHQ